MMDSLPQHNNENLVSNDLISVKLPPQKDYEADVSSFAIRSNEGLTLETNVIFVI